MEGGQVSKGMRRVFKVVIAVAVAGMAAAAGVIAWVLTSYNEGESAYEAVADAAFDVPLDQIAEEAASSAEAGEGGGSAAAAETELDLASLAVNWDALLAQNPDTVGWIYVPGTPINYPVVHSRDNDEYLYVNFNGQRANGLQATYGTPFLMEHSSPDFSDPNNVIQAHNMSNGSMFAWIGNSALKDHDALLDHRTAYLLTPDANYRLTSISVLVCGSDDPVTRSEFSSRGEFTSFVRELVGRSTVDLPVGFDLSEVGRLVSLSTCTSDGNGRRCVLVCAVTSYVDLTGADAAADADTGEAEGPAETEG